MDFKDTNKENEMLEGNKENNIGIIDNIDNFNTFNTFNIPLNFLYRKVFKDVELYWSR